MISADWQGTHVMGRHGKRQNGIRSHIAAAAARIMAEDGVDDFALAKRKAARQLGVDEGQGLPANHEIEAELETYRAIYQADEHPERIRALREIALEAMRALENFNPYLTGAVLKGFAGRYAEIELQLFPESTKDIELYLLDRGIPYGATHAKRYAGDRATAAGVLSLEWNGVPLKLTVLDPRDERLALKTSIAGRVIDRAGIAQLSELLDPAARG